MRSGFKYAAVAAAVGIGCAVLLAPQAGATTDDQYSVVSHRGGYGPGGEGTQVQCNSLTDEIVGGGIVLTEGNTADFVVSYSGPQPTDGTSVKESWVTGIRENSSAHFSYDVYAICSPAP